MSFDVFIVIGKPANSINNDDYGRSKNAPLWVASRVNVNVL